MAWERYYDLSSQELGELIRFPKWEEYKLIHQFSKLNSRHMFSQLPVGSEGRIDYNTRFPKQYIDEDHTLNFTVPIYEPLPPQYFIHKYPPPTELLDLQPLPVTALRNSAYEALYQDFKHFNPVQTQRRVSTISTPEKWDVYSSLERSGMAQEVEQYSKGCLSTSLEANAKDLGEWIGATAHGLFNFPPGVRPVPLEIHIQGVDIANFEARMQSMTKPTYTTIVLHARMGKPAIVYVLPRKHASLTAVDLMTYSDMDSEDTPVFLLQSVNLS
ncbi:hypothetical protein HAX54_003835 [Datura stramonium]|uniref:Uncharacterized protein n=1 Tax=Datura stramonium TaxID=4076 RepID=A0ABS8T767_DATST|nr:hypothetical protein [Datura stramonium]